LSTSIAPLFPGTSSGYPGLQVAAASSLQALLAYDPATDPDAKYFRSLVPLAQRIPAFAATQARPGLSASPQVTNLSCYYTPLLASDTSNGYQYERYANANNVFISRFQQYQDIVGGWQGAQGLPTTAYTDACHRNGALSIGVLFQPYFSNDSSSFVATAPDGSFPVGNQLVDLAAYFGFDGYFLNVEEDLTQAQVSALMAMCNAMQARAMSQGLPVFHLQWYDSVTVDGSLNYQNQLDSANAGWITSGGCNSIFLNYSWGQSQVAVSASEAKSLQLNALTAVFFGLLMEGRDQIGISVSPSEGGGYNPNDIPLVIPTDGNGAPQAGIALFDPALATVRFAQLTNPTLPAMQTGAYPVEGQFWTGATGNPGAPYASTTQNPYGGVSDYITERSVIGSFPFVSRMNAGSGNEFYIDGQALGQGAWFSMSIQDILPTWQWWTKDFNSDSVPAGLLSADLDLIMAFNGGTSLKVSGSLGANNPTELRLFKTELMVPSGDPYTLGVTYYLSQGDASSLFLGLIFQDNPTGVVWIQAPVGAARGTAGWMQSTWNLSAYSGRVLAAISLGFQATDSTTSPYAINIGEIALLNSSSPIQPVVPTGFAIENSAINTGATSAQVRLTWDFDPTTWYYDVYRQQTPGNTQKMIWLGRISCDAYYVAALPRIGTETSATIQLVAVSPDGTETLSNTATTVLDWG
jgi:endo-beta-N-acetylglucosaminidase D